MTETIDASVLDRLSAQAFDPRFGEGWSVNQLAGTLALDGSWARLAREDGVAVGFSLSRLAAGEVELLLVGVVPAWRGRGIATGLVELAKADALNRAALTMFLEVRDGNAAAMQLYRRAGFVAVGRRRDYYRGRSGECFDALTMRFDLGGSPR